MTHGVCPPLTAMIKRPRSATAARASAAMIAAASRATASASAKTSIFIKNVSHSPKISPADRLMSLLCCLIFHNRVLPASNWCNFLVRFARSPGIRIVFAEGGPGLQDWIDDSPCLFDIILSGKQGRVSRHSISQDTFIRIHLVRARVPADDHLVRLADRILARSDDIHAEGHGDLGADPEPEIVCLQIEVRIHRRGLTEPDDDFRAGHGKAFSRPNIEGNTFPSPR